MSEVLDEFDVLLEHYLGFHDGNLLEELELVGGGEIDDVLVLPLAPPLVEGDGIRIVGDPGFDFGGIAGEVDEHLETRDPFVIFKVGPAELGKKGGEDLHLIHFQDLLFHNHPMDADRVHIQPLGDFPGLGPGLPVERQVVGGKVDFLLVKRTIFHSVLSVAFANIRKNLAFFNKKMYI